MKTNDDIINQTNKWIHDVVIGCNFCPFASHVINQAQVRFQVEVSADENICIDRFLQEISLLENDANIETGFIIFPNAFAKFRDYLDGVGYAEHLLKENGYESIFQIASFHPLYRFAKSTESDPANYTNRSVYPMFQLLRESSVEKALLNYENPQNIPRQNIAFARNKGLAFMKMLRNSCLE